MDSDSKGKRKNGYPRIAIIGAGMSGMLMGIKLKAAGIDNITIYEKAEDVGGTWRENRYPGLACDVPAHYYTYSFEANPKWQHRFARGPEIHRYLQSTAEKYDLLRHIRFGQELTRGRHDGKHWHLYSEEELVDTADIVVAATGVLHHPKMPDIEGLDSFAGKCFHSARWPEELDLSGQRVGLIGTGSTGVQIATKLGTQGHNLTLFQRTPQWIFPVPDRNYSAVERWLARSVPWLTNALYRAYELTFEHMFAQAVVNRNSLRYKLICQLVKLNLRRVRDPALRRRLTPDYAPMCKRLIMSWHFYSAMQQEAVTLADQGIERVTPEGVVTTDGKLHKLDTLILATGFHSHDYLRPMELETSAGNTLSKAWAKGPQAHRTVAIPDFPNFYLLLGPKTPIGNYSVISMAETQADYVLACIEKLRQGSTTSLSPKPEITKRLDAELNEATTGTVWASGCTSWYLDENGVPDTWPLTPAAFRDYLREPDFEEFDLH